MFCQRSNSRPSESEETPAWVVYNLLLLVSNKTTSSRNKVDLSLLVALNESAKCIRKRREDF